MTQKLKFILAIVVPIIVVAAAAIAVVLWDKKDPFPEAKVVREYHRKTADDPDIEYLEWKEPRAITGEENYYRSVQHFADPAGGPISSVMVKFRSTNRQGGKQLYDEKYFVQNGRVIATGTQVLERITSGADVPR